MIWLLAAIALIAGACAIYLFLENKKSAARSQSQSKDLSSFQTIIDHTNDALFVIEIIDGKLLYINPAAATLTGYTQAELISKTYFDLLPKEFLARSAEKIADVWENKGLVFTDIPHLHKNGELIMVECSAKTGSFEDHPVVVIYARDIRERLKYEHAIKEMNSELTQKNKDITDSIRYALRIQQAILPEEEQVQKLLPEYFILYKPKDIVSGDFYFVDKIRMNDGTELIGMAVGDCTGHGVPGAFMTMLGNSFLKQSLTEPTVNKPCEAIEFIDKKLQEVLKYKEKQSFIRDGMDISFGVITPDKKTLYFAAANHVAYILHTDKTITQVKGDRQAVGQLKDPGFKYTTHVVPLTTGDRIYFFTDGYADQFGGPKGKKFKYKQLEEVLVSSHHLSMNEQKKLLDKTIEEWKFYSANGVVKEHEQVDDILMIGVAV